MSVYGEALSNQAAQVSDYDRGAGGLVTCTGFSDCNFCSFGAMVNKIINWLFGFLTVAAVLILAWAGFRLVTSGGDTTVMQWAKERIVYVIIGFVLMLASWLIVDTILRGLTGSEQGMNFWGSFDVENCGFMREPQSRTYDEYEVTVTLEEMLNEQTAGPINNPNGTSVTPDIEGMVSLNEMGLVVANGFEGISGPGRTDLAHPEVAAAALRMQELAVQRYGQPVFQVTAAYTDGVGHSANSRHYQGIAIDFDPVNGASTQQVANLAREVGFTFVLDEGSHVHGDMR